MSGAMLPAEFRDLEPFAPAWCLASEAERYTKRLASGMAEMQAFYDACFPRLRAALAYLDRIPLEALPPDALNLLHLLYSLIMVSLPVEVWKQPRVIDSGTAFFPRTVDPAP
jgi:hypothetical protein